jgi:hypothetical protein
MSIKGKLADVRAMVQAIKDNIILAKHAKLSKDVDSYFAHSSSQLLVQRIAVEEIKKVSQKMPICYASKSGEKRWFLNGQLHRKRGPAVLLANGEQSWYLHGSLHRLDGPALIYADGGKEWWSFGREHRLDGPAIERNGCAKEWWINGEKLTESEFKLRKKEPKYLDWTLTPTHILKIDGTREWRLHDELHRINGPAFISKAGHEEWWQKGLRHREDGPAVIFVCGDKQWWVKGLMHRVDGPAVEKIDGTKSWYQYGVLHREDGPAIQSTWNNVIVTKNWYLNGKLLTEDQFRARIKTRPKRKSNGPLIVSEEKPTLKISALGNKEWRLRNVLHREDGPAIEQLDGTKSWWRHGKLHREDGPALECTQGFHEWYINGQQLSEEEFNLTLNPCKKEVPQVGFFSRIASTGATEYYFNGRLHREGGRAIEFPGGAGVWCLYGNCGSKEWYDNEIKKIKSEQQKDEQNKNELNAMLEKINQVL